MLESQRNFLTETTPKATSPPQLSSPFPPIKQKMMYKDTTIVTQIPEKTAARTPAEIGTRGTVGSLVMREIKYFSQLELGCQKKSEKPRCQVMTKMPPTTKVVSKPKLGSLITTPKRKKKQGGKLIPSMCSLVEVAESTRPKMVSGFNYKNLKADVKKLQP